MPRWFGVGFLLAGCPGDVPSDTADTDLPFTQRIDSIVELSGSVNNARLIYETRCQVCHGTGYGGKGGPTLEFSDDFTDRELVNLMLRGAGTMPDFADLSNQELADLLAWLRDFAPV